MRDTFYLSGGEERPVSMLSTAEIHQILAHGRVESLDPTRDVGAMVERLKIELLIRELGL